MLSDILKLKRSVNLWVCRWRLSLLLSECKLCPFLVSFVVEIRICTVCQGPDAPCGAEAEMNTSEEQWTDCGIKAYIESKMFVIPTFEKPKDAKSSRFVNNVWKYVLISLMVWPKLADGNHDSRNHATLPDAWLVTFDARWDAQWLKHLWWYAYGAYGPYGPSHAMAMMCLFFLLFGGRWLKEEHTGYALMQMDLAAPCNRVTPWWMSSFHHSRRNKKFPHLPSLAPSLGFRWLDSPWERSKRNRPEIILKKNNWAMSSKMLI